MWWLEELRSFDARVKDTWPLPMGCEMKSDRKYLLQRSRVDQQEMCDFLISRVATQARLTVPEIGASSR